MGPSWSIGFRIAALVMAMTGHSLLAAGVRAPQKQEGADTSKAVRQTVIELDSEDNPEQKAALANALRVGQKAIPR